MASNVIQEFVVSLSPKVDKKKARQFRQDQKESQKSVKDLTKGIGELASAFKAFSVATGIAATLSQIKELANSFTGLYNAAKVQGVSVKFIDSIGNAFKAVGGNAETAQNAISAFAQQVQRNKLATNALLTFLGIDPTGDIEKDFIALLKRSKELRDLEKQGDVLASKQLDIVESLGLGRDLINIYAEREVDFNKALNEGLARSTSLLANAAKASADFTSAWAIFIQKLQTDLLPAFTKFIELLTFALEISEKLFKLFARIKDLVVEGITEKFKKAFPNATNYIEKGVNYLKDKYKGYYHAVERAVTKKEESNKKEGAGSSSSPASLPAPTGQPKSGGAGGKVSAKQIYDDLIALGFPKAAAVGFAVNAIRESGGNPNAQVIDTNNRLSTGLFQFNNQSFYDEYAKLNPGKKLENATYGEQLRYLAQSKAPDIVNAIKASSSAKTAIEASNIVTRKFEKPKDLAGAAIANEKVIEKNKELGNINLNVNIHGVPLDEGKLSNEIISQANQARLIQGAR